MHAIISEVTASDVTLGKVIGSGRLKLERPALIVSLICVRAGTESTVYEGVWNNEVFAIRKPKITGSIALLRYEAELALLK